MSFVKETVDKLLKGYDIRLRPDFGGKWGVRGRCGKRARPTALAAWVEEGGGGRFRRTAAEWGRGHFACAPSSDSPPPLLRAARSRCRSLADHRVVRFPQVPRSAWG